MANDEEDEYDEELDDDLVVEDDLVVDDHFDDEVSVEEVDDEVDKIRRRNFPRPVQSHMERSSTSFLSSLLNRNFKIPV